MSVSGLRRSALILVVPLLVSVSAFANQQEIFESAIEYGDPPAIKGPMIARGVEVKATPRSPFCVIPDRRYCRHDPPGPRGAPCSCSGIGGRYR